MEKVLNEPKAEVTIQTVTHMERFTREFRITLTWPQEIPTDYVPLPDTRVGLLTRIDRIGPYQLYYGFPPALFLTPENPSAARGLAHAACQIQPYLRSGGNAAIYCQKRGLSLFDSRVKENLVQDQWTAQCLQGFLGPDPFREFLRAYRLDLENALRERGLSLGTGGLC